MRQRLFKHFTFNLPNDPMRYAIRVSIQWEERRSSEGLSNLPNISLLVGGMPKIQAQVLLAFLRTRKSKGSRKLGDMRRQLLCTKPVLIICLPNNPKFLLRNLDEPYFQILQW